jgi:hypothetical protein
MRRQGPSGKWPAREMQVKSPEFAGFLSLPILESMQRFFEIIFTA